jgi:uncharacterized protein (TIGR02453 family)
MAFTGIPTAALDFYEDLAADNSKAFWTAHKDTYDESVKAPMEALAGELAKEFGPAKLFRPYRDTRFAADKSPYKTNQGMWFGESSVYVHLDAAGLMVAGGYWQTAPDQVQRLREAVADDTKGEALLTAIRKVERSGAEIGGDQLKRVPTGYAKDGPRADLMRYKTLTAHRELGAPDWLASAKARSEVAKALRGLSPLTVWLAQNVGPSAEPRR